jgi:hypothetical protein
MSIVNRPGVKYGDVDSGQPSPTELLQESACVINEEAIKPFTDWERGFMENITRSLNSGWTLTAAQD